MTETQFLEAISIIEQELMRKGMSLAQIEDCEITALEMLRGEFYRGPHEYIQTVSRLANSGLY
jgi:hypothetical protein